MRTFFEKKRDNYQQIYIIRNGKRIFPPHFHSNLEIFIVKNGKYTVSNNNKIYEISSGEIFIFESFDIHGYDTKITENSEDIVIIIPYKYLNNFNAFKKGKTIENSHIKNKELIEKLLKIIDEIEKSEIDYKTQALIDLFLATLSEELTFTNKTEKTDSYLIRQILNYMENNFKNECNRESIAQSLGYSKTYVSKVFNSFIKMNISSYVNTLRLNYIESNLNKDKTILELIYESGFKSQQTYYRFLKNNK